MNIRSFYFCFLLSIALFACKPDAQQTIITDDFKGVFVVNEGGFGKSNGSIGLYKPGSQQYFDAYKTANGIGLGDVVQSMTLIDGKYYIAVNNSNKIEVVNQADFKSLASIATNSPRYVLKTATNKAFVSNLYSNTVKVVNTSNYAIESSVDVHHNTDQLMLFNSKVLAITFDQKIMVIDPSSNSLIDSISSASGLSKMVAANQGVYLLCTGLLDWNTGATIEKGAIQFVNDTFGVEQSWPLMSASYGGSMVYANSLNALLFSLGDNKIIKMAFDGTMTDWLVLPTGQSVYGLNWDAQNAQLYISDAGDFNANGKVYVYDAAANKVKEISAGIAPNGVVLNP